MRTPGLQGGFRDDLDLTNLWGHIPGPRTLLADYGPNGAPILLVGDGPATCISVRTVVSRRPVRIYDVNRFYARLGVEPGAPWSALVRAYVAADSQGDAEMTEILMILKDPESRAAYDRMPPYQRYADSATVAGIRNAEAVRAMRAGVTFSGDEEYGLTDKPASTAQQSWQKHASIETEDQSGWGYAHYLWSVLATPSASAGLPDWQSMVSAALDGDGGPPLRFGVGRHALGSATAGIDVGGIPVAFLSAGTAPQAQEAQRAATQLRALTCTTTA